MDWYDTYSRARCWGFSPRDAMLKADYLTSEPWPGSVWVGLIWWEA